MMTDRINISLLCLFSGMFLFCSDASAGSLSVGSAASSSSSNIGGQASSAVPSQRSCALLTGSAIEGAIPDGRSSQLDVSASRGQTRIQVGQPVFSATDVGKSIGISGIGPNADTLVSKINKYISPTTIELSQPASTTVSSRPELVQWGTDFSPLLDLAISQNAPGSVLSIRLLPGAYFLSRSVNSQGRFVSLDQNPLTAVVGPGRVTFDQSEGVRAGYRYFMSRPAAGIQPPGGIVGQRISIHNQNTTNGVEQGEKFEYWSDATGGPGGVFDVARVTLGTWQAKSGMETARSHLAAYDDWQVAISPETDASQMWGTAVAEWNIVNRGPDDGWAAARGNPHRRNTGGLLLVPEASTFGQSKRGAIGRNVLYAVSIAHSASKNVETEQHAAFYNGYLVEPNSIVGVGQDPTGLGGRAFYATGDITGNSSDRPYAPMEFSGAWTHGIRTDKATLSDNSALGMAPGQMVSWVHNGAGASISGSYTNGKIDLELAPFGQHGMVLVSGKLVDQAGAIVVGQDISHHSALSLNTSGDQGDSSQLVYAEAGVTGWSLGTTSNGGAVSGTTFALSRYSPSGEYRGQVFSVDSNTGNVTFDDHVKPANSTKPHIEAGQCGPGTASSVFGSDQAGKVTITSNPTKKCVVTFGSSWKNPPDACILGPANSIAARQSLTLAYVGNISTFSWSIVGAHLEGASYYYHCF